MREAALHFLAHGAHVAHQVARAQEQVEKIELARALFETLVRGERRPQLLAESCGEVGLGADDERVEDLFRLVAAGEDRGLLQTFAEPLSAASPAPELLFGELAERRLEPVLVATADRLASLQLLGEPGHFQEPLGDPVLRVASPGGKARHVREPIDHLRKLRAPIERLSSPGGVEVAVLGERPGGIAERLPRIHPIPPTRATPQRAPDAFARRRELALEPGLERLVE